VTEVKSQHYIPRFLLKHFCANGKTISVTDLKIKNTYKTNINNVAQENRFYNLKTMQGEVSLEEMFSGLESKVAPIVDKIVTTESIGWLKDENFDLLEDFVLCQFYRTRKSVNNTAKILKSENVPIFDRYNANGEKVGTLYSGDLDIDDNMSKTLTYNILNHMEHNDVVRDAMSSMEWLLLKTPENKKFIMSDSPVVLISSTGPTDYKGETAGFELPDAQILFPISSRLLLLLSARQMVDDSKNGLLRALMTGKPIKVNDAYKCSITGEPYICEERLVDFFNKIQKTNAERYVYGDAE
jgi:hypothetical protein